MLHQITQLKAPWPAGARAGDIIDLPDPLPGWAVGKCVPSADGAVATVALAPVESPRDLAAELRAAMDALADAEAELAAEREAADALRAKLADAEAAPAARQTKAGKA